MIEERRKKHPLEYSGYLLTEAGARCLIKARGVFSKLFTRKYNISCGRTKGHPRKNISSFGVGNTYIPEGAKG